MSEWAVRRQRVLQRRPLSGLDQLHLGSSHLEWSLKVAILDSTSTVADPDLRRMLKNAMVAALVLPKR